MKTERLTLLVSPADKAALAARATSLNMSVSELVRRAALDYDPADAELIDELQALLPEFNDAVGRIRANLTAATEASEAHVRRMDWLQSQDHRDEVRREIASDTSLDWDALSKIFGGRQ